MAQYNITLGNVYEKKKHDLNFVPTKKNVQALVPISLSLKSQVLPQSSLN